MNTDKYPFKKTFPATGTFGALNAAQDWLKEKGFSLGVLSSPEPCGIVKGTEQYVPKWRYLDHNALDGVATSSNWREGEVVVHLLADPG